jgi:hypothetical protein
MRTLNCGPKIKKNRYRMNACNLFCFFFYIMNAWYLNKVCNVPSLKEIELFIRRNIWKPSLYYLGPRVVEIIGIPYKTMKRGQNLDVQKNKMVNKYSILNLFWG